MFQKAASESRELALLWRYFILEILCFGDCKKTIYIYLLTINEAWYLQSKVSSQYITICIVFSLIRTKTISCQLESLLFVQLYMEVLVFDFSFSFLHVYQILLRTLVIVKHAHPQISAPIQANGETPFPLVLLFPWSLTEMFGVHLISIESELWIILWIFLCKCGECADKVLWHFEVLE